ncbi:hypothetical protein BR141012304_11133 [Brucella inopinata]|nr:hypothetical protein BR141012304_11133 [Brucella inopinata]
MALYAFHILLRALLQCPDGTLGEEKPGKGIPSCITIYCETIAMDRSSQGSPRIRRRYLNHNSKVALYVDLGNFCFFHLTVESASLNGGFGKALNSIRMIT